MSQINLTSRAYRSFDEAHEYVLAKLGESEWRARAACADPDVPERWFFADKRDTREKRLRQARQVCAGCPVKRACVTVAVTDRLEGTWGGTTALEREQARELGLDLELTVTLLLNHARRVSLEGPMPALTSPAEWVEPDAA